MTKPAKSRATPSDDERPEDLFDDIAPLETIPAGPARVGPGHPPARSRWKKGDPSPNPAGRPRKPSGGPMTNRLSKKIAVMVEGRSTTMTQREAMDRLLRDLATRKGGKYLDLWNERKARDQRLQEEREAYETQQRQLKELRTEAPAQWEYLKKLKEHRAGWRLMQEIDRLIPGVLDVHIQLLKADAIDKGSKNWKLADWLRAKRRR